MPRPSVFEQLPGATQVKPNKLLPSPRHWNAGMAVFGGKLWLAYRHHTGQEGRCAIAICSIDDKSFQPTSVSYLLNFPDTQDHFEDPRLFIFNDTLHVSYTRMNGYRPGVDYNCVVEYASLVQKDKGIKWSVDKVWRPNYGMNHGYAKEKNWSFFEVEKKLYCFYQSHPQQVILELDGDQVVEEHFSPPITWPWGLIRGGASIVKYGENLLHVFHSSLPTEQAPHYVRYYAGACVMSGRAPFQALSISGRPIAVGSELDSHKVDPRYVQGWKPFVVFPCGCVSIRKNLYVSMGVNDWQTVVAPVKELHLINVGTPIKPRYFKTQNGSLPQRILIVEGSDLRSDWVSWEVPRSPNHVGAGVGYMKAPDARVAEEFSTDPNITEIDEKTYLSATANQLSWR